MRRRAYNDSGKIRGFKAALGKLYYRLYSSSGSPPKFRCSKHGILSYLYLKHYILENKGYMGTVRVARSGCIFGAKPLIMLCFSFVFFVYLTTLMTIWLQKYSDLATLGTVAFISALNTSKMKIISIIKLPRARRFSVFVWDQIYAWFSLNTTKKSGCSCSKVRLTLFLGHPAVLVCVFLPLYFYVPVHFKTFIDTDKVSIKRFLSLSMLVN